MADSHDCDDADCAAMSEPDAVVADQPIAISRVATKPELNGAIRVSFEDGIGIAGFAELIARMARLGKTVEISIRIVDDE